MRSRLAGVVLLLIAIAGCTASPAGTEGGPSPSEPATPTPGIEPSTAPPISSVSPAVAARRLLAAEAVDVTLKVVREKRPTDPVETLVTGTGRLEPAIGRGHILYDLAGLFALPRETPAPSSRTTPLPSPHETPPPTTLDAVDVIWTPDDLHVRVADVPAGAWQTRTREEGRLSGGLIGRLPDEPLGLVTLVAGSEPGRTVRLEDAELAGSTAERWSVTVPVEAAVVAGVPADVPDAAAIQQQYGISEVGIEVWLVDGDLRRLLVAFHREKAPYGGPDLTTTTYDWQPATDGIPIEIPA